MGAARGTSASGPTAAPTGSCWGSGTLDTLFVNGDRVGVGVMEPQARLHVAGGDIRLEGGRTFYAPGRMHVHGDETLYLLNLQGVVISRAWGGNGDLTVEGGAWKPGGGPFSVSSDMRLKRGIEPLKGALQRLSRLRGVNFEWRKPEEQGNLTGTQMGLVAQEVEEVLPEWVETDRNGYKILTIRGFETLAVEAFKDLKAQNDELRGRIEALERA